MRARSAQGAPLVAALSRRPVVSSGLTDAKLSRDQSGFCSWSYRGARGPGPRAKLDMGGGGGGGSGTGSGFFGRASRRFRIISSLAFGELRRAGRDARRGHDFIGDLGRRRQVLLEVIADPILHDPLRGVHRQVQNLLARAPSRSPCRSARPSAAWGSSGRAPAFSPPLPVSARSAISVLLQRRGLEQSLAAPSRSAFPAARTGTEAGSRARSSQPNGAICRAFWSLAKPAALDFAPSSAGEYNSSSFSSSSA